MSTIARLRRWRQRDRRAVFRDYDIVWLSLFVGVPLIAVLVAYLLGMQQFRVRVAVWQCSSSVSVLVCVPRQQVQTAEAGAIAAQQQQQARQAVPKAFYAAFEEVGE